jgi:hypothetical protein
MAKQSFGSWDKYTYSLNDSIKNHALLNLTYKAEKWALIGTWNAAVGPTTSGTYNIEGQFPLGGLIDFEGLKSAVLLSRKPNKNKSWNLSGNDIGRLLDRTIPDPSLLPSGDVNAVVTLLCQKCDVPCSVTGGLPSSVVADARALISATKVADAIVELAQLSGRLAYIDVSSGTLKFADPSEAPPTYTDDDILEYGGDELDLDNYSKGVCVILHRKKSDDEEDDEEDPDDPPGHFFYGTAPPSLSQESFSMEGIFGTRIMPLNLPVSTTTTTSETIQISDTYNDPSSGGGVEGFGSITITTDVTETFEYERGHKVNEGVSPSSDAPHETSYGPSYRDFWDIPRSQEGAPYYNDNTQHREYKWVEAQRTKTTIVTKTMTGPVLNITVRETTVEETLRTFDNNRLLIRETYSSRTTKELVSSSYGNTLPDASLYTPLAPSFDKTQVSVFNRTGGAVIITKTTTANELQEVGSWTPIRVWNNDTKEWEQVMISASNTQDRLRQLVVKGIAFPEFVQHITVEVSKEFIGDNGEVSLKSNSKISDGGSAYVMANGWAQPVQVGPSVDPGSETPEQQELNLIYAAYTAFSSQASSSSVEMSGGSASDDISQSENYDGVTWYWKNIPGGDDWYDPTTGGYAQHGGVCPHYNDKNCNIADIDVIWDYTERKCPNKEGRGWSGCPRALAALENQQSDAKDIQFAPPIVCHSTQYPAAGTYEPVYFRNVYIRDDIPGNTKEERDAAARVIGIQLANNLHKVRSARGWVRTITVPLDLSIHISGSVMSVSHDYKAKRTTLTYRIAGDVPDFLNSNSPQSMAFYIWERENNRNTRSVYGSVLEIISKKKVIVQVGDGEVTCTSNIISLKEGDSVRVSLPAGNRMDGTIEERV